MIRVKVVRSVWTVFKGKELLDSNVSTNFIRNVFRCGWKEMSLVLFADVGYENTKSHLIFAMFKIGYQLITNR